MMILTYFKWFVYVSNVKCDCLCFLCLTRLCVESTGVEEVHCEVNVHITEEKQHISSFPGPGPNV